MNEASKAVAMGGAIVAKRSPLRYWILACAAALAFGLVVARSAADSREHEDHDIWFVHATDPHIFLPAAQAQDKETKDVGGKQHELNEKALSDMLKRIRSLPDGDGPPAFLVLSGDLGVDPCFIAKSENPPSKQIPAAQGQTQPRTEADNNDKQNGPAGPSAKDCLNAVDPDKRKDQIKRAAEVLGQSPVQDIYLVAGNNDIANEVADDPALGYFNQFIEDVQAKLVENKSSVHLHNLTRCYASGEAASMCYADIADTAYRLIGFPSYSFKNADVGVDNTEAQAKQLDTFRRLLEDSRQAGKRVLVISHATEIDDPFVLAQDRYTGKAPAKPIGKETNNPRSAWSTWNVSKKVLDEWKDVLTSDSVVAVLAGHLHDSHKEIYRQPYTWSSVNDHRAAFHKLFPTPPLAVKNQDTSPIQARGFSLMHLEPDRIESQLFWYNSETGDFAPDPETKYQQERWKWSRAIIWLWNLDKADQALMRMAVLLIAFLTAFLTIVAIWQIPPTNDPFADNPKTAHGTPNTTADSSPFSNKFGKTVVAGLSGLAVTEVAKALGNQQSSADTRWYYIVWFILFFFFLLMSLNLYRAAVEALRARVAVVYYPLARPGRVTRCNREKGTDRSPSRWHTFKDSFSYWVLGRPGHWLFSLRVPLLTFFDTFINLIQGKNQTMTRVFQTKVIDQQRNVIRVADAIRADLNELIESRVRQGRQGRLADRVTQIAKHCFSSFGRGRYAVPAPEDSQHVVRVNISVLSADQSSVFYISRTPGSAHKPFPKRSVAWVSVFTGQIRWYQSAYRKLTNYKEIILFDNHDGAIAGDEDQILLDTHYQARQDDYQAFVLIPVPWPRRGFGGDYVKGAIHISFREDADLGFVWKADEMSPKGTPPKYPATERMLDEDCNDDGIGAALRNSIAVLGELLRGFNEDIYKYYIEPNQSD